MHKFRKFIFGIKLYMFRTVPLSIISSFPCTHSNGIRHTVYSYSLRAGSGRSFIPKNKFEKLVHLFGFIIRIYHDALSPERQI